MDTIINKDNSPQLLINNITIKPLVRGNSDIDRWRDALRAADKGKRQQLYSLYEDLLLDNILFDAIDKRILAITNSKITFTRNNGIEDEIDDLIGSSEFEKLLTEIMLSKFWGISVIELEFDENGIVVHSFPRKHLRPNFGEVALSETDERGVSYVDNDFIMKVGGDDDLGLILRAAPYVIYKRNNIGDWAQYAEIFGMPIRVFEYETYDEAARVETIRAAEESGGNPIVVIPKGTGFDVKPGAASGDGSIYDRLRQACNEEILIGILGQTLTTVQGDTGARALGEVHMSEQDAKHKADRHFVERVLNSELLPILEKRGYPVSDGFFCFPEASEEISLLDRMTIIRDASILVPIGTQYIYETFGIPCPGSGEELLPMPSPYTEQDKDQQEYPGGKASNVMERFMRFFASAPTSNLVGAAQDIETSPEDDSATRLAKRIANGAIVPLDPDLFSEQSNNLLRAFTNGYAGKRPLNAADEFSYDWQSPAVITAMENNLYRFSAGKTIAQIQALNELYRKSKNFAEFAKAAQTIDHKFNCQWAQTEYITAGAVAESTATYNRLTTQREIFPYWEYKTVGDAQVRPEHAELDGVVLPMSDAAWSKIYPPNGWRCRCYVVPRMRHEVSGIDLQSMRQKVEDYYKTDDYKNASKQGFGVNRSITGMVFAENQNYVNLIATNKFLDKMRIKDWGARPMAEMIAKSKFTMPVYSGTADEWIKENPYLVSNDNRQHTIPDIVFRRHTTGKYASGKNNRVPLLQGLKDVITCPDEIWLNSEQNKTAPNNRIYIKFYSSQSIVVVSKITNGKLQIHTWFTLAPDAENDFRRGILIKKATQE